MTTPTQGEHAQTEALYLAACFDDNTSVVGAKRIAAEFRRLDAENKALHAQVAALTALTAQPAAPQGVAYAELPTECDSPELCAVSKSCAGQFGTQRICASNGQAPAQPVALPSDRELQEIATQAAWRHSRETDAPKYLPRSPVHAATWKPHAWVVAAMKDAIEAATQPKKDHHDELS